MHIRSGILATAAAALTITSCGDSAGPKAINHLGRYDLVSVDGNTLPYTTSETATIKHVLASGAWTLNADSTFVEETVWEFVANGVPGPPLPATCRGTYHRNGTSFTMNGEATSSCTGGASTATGDGHTFTAEFEGATFVFRR